MTEIFTISDDYIELNKLLKASGLCGSGGQAKMVIEDNLVSVGGIIETRKRRKIKDGMTVTCNARSLKVVKAPIQAE